MRFGVLVNPTPIDESKPATADNLYVPGWVGLGWSAWEPRNGPPQMINGSAVMGWLDTAGQQHVRTQAFAAGLCISNPDDFNYQLFFVKVPVILQAASSTAVLQEIA